jgi:CheY-like chemotaxis protein
MTTAAMDDRLARWRSKRVSPVPRVLVVDDEDDFLELSELFLAADGWGVIKAHSAEEAMKAVREEPPDFALVDLYIPGRDGFEVLRELRNEPTTEDIPVFATTAADLDDAEGLLRIGFDGHFPKPVNWPRLREVLRLLATR